MPKGVPYISPTVVDIKTPVHGKKSISTGKYFGNKFGSSVVGPVHVDVIGTKYPHKNHHGKNPFYFFQCSRDSLLSVFGTPI